MCPQCFGFGGVWALIVLAIGPIGKLVNTGELAHTSQSQELARLVLVKIEGEFYNRTTTAECSEDRTAVPSMVKTESELYVHQCVSILHTHTTERLQNGVTKPTNTECT